MTFVPDVLAIIGAALVVTGVYLEFGIAYAFIVAGVCLGALAINMARLINASNVGKTKTRGDTQHG